MQVERLETLILATLAYFLGREVTRHVGWLQRNSVPEAVTGGFAVAVVVSVIAHFAGPIEFATHGRDSLLLAFFATVGLEARWDRLRSGGRSLFILVGFAVLMLPIQSLVGAGSVALTGGRPVYGILGGSVALSGGAGTVLAWAPEFERLGLARAEELGLAVAAMGMLLGAAIGAPLGRWLVRRKGLEPEEERPPVLVSPDQDQAKPAIVTADLLAALLAVALSMGLGLQAHSLLLALGAEVPTFATTLLAGALLANALPRLFPNRRSPASTPAMGLLSDVTLNLFVAMAIMAIPLGVVAEAIHHILVLLVLEVVVLVLYVAFLVFPALGRNYDAAVMSSGYFGLAMGATPIAVANMNAIARQCGPSPRAMLVVPLIGLAFFDVIHVVIVKWLLAWLA